MQQKEHIVIPLFKKFLNACSKGKRLKPDGSRIKSQTVINYGYALKYLQEYETKTGIVLRIKKLSGNNQRAFIAEKKYWRTFYQTFTDFLYTTKNCFDNYVGSIIRIIRAFFYYLNKELGLTVGEFYKDFYVCREQIPIITLMPEQLHFLINEKSFSETLSPVLQKAKDIFVFGCTVALRVSDLFTIKFTDIEKRVGVNYLRVKTIKTGAVVRIKLPEYAIEIIERFKKTAGTKKIIFSSLPPERFNEQIKILAETAGWTMEMGKKRSKRGKAIESLCSRSKNKYRFCDLVTSHTMRKTAITTMLMLGMKEHVVKQISGHSRDSKSFHRYVNLVQSYMDNEMDEVFNKLAKMG